MSQTLHQTLTTLRLSGLATTIDMRLNEARTHNLDPGEFLELLLQDELNVRKQRKIGRRTKAAAFREHRTLETFDFSFNASINRRQIYELATGSFVEQARDVLLIGPPGTGKSHLAQAIGHELIKTGKTVLYRSIFDLVTELLNDENHHHHERLMTRYLKADLLIIDDMGIKHLPQKSGEYLFEIIMRRYELKSTLMTSNRPLEEWGKLIGDVPAATAILDRFLHHAEIIKINGRSYRLQDRIDTTAAAESGGAHCRPPHPPARVSKDQERKPEEGNGACEPISVPTAPNAEKTVSPEEKDLQQPQKTTT